MTFFARLFFAFFFFAPHLLTSFWIPAEQPLQLGPQLRRLAFTQHTIVAEDRLAAALLEPVMVALVSMPEEMHARVMVWFLGSVVSVRRLADGSIHDLAADVELRSPSADNVF